MVDGLMGGGGVVLEEGSVLFEFLASFPVVVDLPGPECFLLVVGNPSGEVPGGINGRRLLGVWRLLVGIVSGVGQFLFELDLWHVFVCSPISIFRSIRFVEDGLDDRGVEGVLSHAVESHHVLQVELVDEDVVGPVGEARRGSPEVIIGGD